MSKTIEDHLEDLGFPGKLTDTERRHIATAIHLARLHGASMLCLDKGRIRSRAA